MMLPDKIWVNGADWTRDQFDDSDTEYIRNDPKVLLEEVERRLEINSANGMWRVWDVEDITPEDLEVQDE